MRPLPIPTNVEGEPLLAGAVFRLCISRVRKRELRERLAAVEQTVDQASQDYQTAAATETLHTFPREDIVGANVTKDEMIAVYEGRMVQEGQPGRPVYDRILSAPPLGICPLCELGKVSTLDHHLPKTEYPVLAVTPINLVPACTWCQFVKRTMFPNNANEQTLHPYFDDIDGGTWLRAEVVEEAPATFRFFVDCPQNWGETLSNRIRYHFNTFQLGGLYSANAGNELSNIRYRLRNLFASGGPVAVQAHLNEEATSRQHARLNSWETAMYSCAANSNWFCNAGFD